MTTRFRIAGSVFAAAALAIATVALFSGSVATLADRPPGGGGGAFCGGIAGIPCPSGCVCVDDPRDDCNPKTGGADCSGICKPLPGSHQGCSGGGSESFTEGSESFTEGSFTSCDPAKEPGVGENPACAETYTCGQDGSWLCINLDGTPTQ